MVDRRFRGGGRAGRLDRAGRRGGRADPGEPGAGRRRRARPAAAIAATTKAKNEAETALAETARAKKETDEALTQKGVALSQSEEARKRAEAVLGFLKNDVLAAARPEGQKGGLGVEVTVRKAVDAAEPKIAGTFKDQPIVEADVRDTLGSTYSYLRETLLAIPQFERALELRQDEA